MDLISWGGGRIGDKDGDGNLELEIKGVKVLSTFSVPDIKVEVPTSMIAGALVAIGQNAAAKMPWAAALGRLLK